MGINLELTNENGVPIAEPLLDPRSLLPRLLLRAPRDSHCLQFIDPYGDTVFNQLQLNTLIAELEAMRPKLPEPDLRAHLDSVISLLDTIRDDAHHYAKFIGD